MVSKEEKILIGGAVAGLAVLVGALALSKKAVAVTPSPTPQPTTTQQITLSAPSTDTVGNPITVTATYTSNGNPVSGATLYLFSYYSPNPVNASSIPSTSFTLVSSATTDSSGQASWEFTPTEAGYYYLMASNNNPPS
ncbi:hypothetical protein B9Q02_11440 [Candidatus Marsarchaeota G1 archaeon BE_D]|jgi:Bacterial Ig-like domain (group 1).|uniref:Big-1 domain-containing protein n=1 Tax=Candidatus Marsarchaeota G1 archaeon BE_D TaxID=1978156 RepID=A0A2R6A8A0_9ARCH|nr:MAG: hypothetical protein B9Q02_11440 [Candidatus Marsarchaeota G1 archaeon BE_D]